jgi:predicted nucleotide-binding protein
VRKPSRARPIQPPARLTQEEIRQGVDRLAKRLEEVNAFEPTSVAEQANIPHVEALAAAVDESLVRTFGADTLDYRRYSDAGFFDNGPFNYAFQVPISQVHASLSRSKARSIALLTQAVKSLEERLAEYSATPLQQSDPEVQESFQRKVFIVHGRDDGPREAVARFLERLGFEPVILHERANLGRTVIEKVEAHSDVGFAIVLLTPDDEGNLVGERPRPRARQNVLLELGYFIGKLTRQRVCTFKVGDLEIPSDWRGVIDEPFDTGGGWRQTLARELDAAGYEIDWKKVMR